MAQTPPCPELEPHADCALVRNLAASGYRPNLLITCSPGRSEAVAQELNAFAALPLRSCALPGELLVPEDRRGTLILNDVAKLTHGQQIALLEYLNGGGRGDLQIVSLTDEPIHALVQSGQFHETLYYLLNVIRLTHVGSPIFR